ncbi:MAG: hypothetical protein A2Y16_06690 [Tenericutes bacterium GWF2_57_13]|nr:MAG: hypothetical protein A2Y16_06690 [Tenericutes bacterium GWF2_57_13]
MHFMSITGIHYIKWHFEMKGLNNIFWTFGVLIVFISTLIEFVSNKKTAAAVFFRIQLRKESR